MRSFFFLILFAGSFCTPLLCHSADNLKLAVFREDGSVAFTSALKENACFSIHFTHSVAKSPVEDWFCRRNNALFLEKTVYHDFGAGLPHNAEAGQSLHVEDGKIILEGFHRKLPRFTVRVGRIANHTLHIEGPDGPHTYPLTLFAAPGRPLSFALTRELLKGNVNEP